MTPEIPEAPTRPDAGRLDAGRLDAGRSDPAAPVARGVIRFGRSQEPPARGRAAVRGAIDPALRHAPPWVPLRRERDRPAPVPVPVPSIEPSGGEFPEAAAAPIVEDVPEGPASPVVEDVPEGPASPMVEDVPRPSVARRRRWGALLPVAAGALAAVVAGTGYLAVSERSPLTDIGRWTGTAPAVAPAATAGDEAPFAVPADGGTADPFGVRKQVVTGAPTRLRVGAIGVDTALEALRLDGGGALTPPKDFAKAGFYAGGTLPGDVGPAVIAGHVDSRKGPAIFYRLREMQAGDRIEVVRGGRPLTFVVTSIAWYPKSDFPASVVYGPTPDRQLRLITCGGVFDHGLRSYRDNLVVYAVAG